MQSDNLVIPPYEAVSTAFTSPGIAAVLAILNNSRKNNILDLGKMSQSNIQFFSQLNCKLFVEHLGDSLDDLNKGADIDDYLLNYGEQTQFDAILTWDLFNYIDLKQLTRLISRIKKNCKPDTLMHVISYTKSTIPELPLHFSLLNEKQMDVPRAHTVERKYPAYSAFQLLSHLPQFIAQDTWLPRENMMPGAMEYTFRFNTRHPREVETKGAAVKHVFREFSDTNKTDHQSPGVADLVAQLRGTANPQVLDLGQQIDENVTLLKGGSGRVFVENLVTSMGGLGHQQEGKARRIDLGRHTIDYGSDQIFDAIFVWDILNYMQLDQIEQLAEKLGAYCKKGTKLFALCYTHRNMPESPRRFRVNEKFLLSYNDTPDNYLNIPLFTTLDLLKRMRGFRIEKTYLLKPGMQSGITELLLRYDG